MSWAHLYGLLATACGYSYPEIDAMTLPAVYELLDYWREHPPVHLLIGAYLGRRSASGTARSDLGELLAMAGENGALRSG